MSMTFFSRRHFLSLSIACLVASTLVLKQANAAIAKAEARWRDEPDDCERSYAADVTSECLFGVVARQEYLAAQSDGLFG